MLSIAVIAPSLAGMLALVLAPAIAWRRRARGASRFWFTFYFLATAVWLAGVGWTRYQSIPPEWSGRLVPYGVWILTLVTLVLSRVFLTPLGKRHTFWVWPLVASAALATLLEVQLVGPQKPWLLNSGWPREHFLIVGLGACWLLGQAGLILHWRRARRATARQAMHRNRVSVWASVLASLLASDILFLIGHESLGASVRAAALLLLGYLLLGRQLPDMRQLSRQALALLLASGAVALLFSGGALLGDWLLRSAPGRSPWLISLAMALLTAYLFPSLWQKTNRWLGRDRADQAYDTQKLVSEYSANIANIVELNRLEAVVVALISQALAIEHGTLFLVDRCPDLDCAYEFRSGQSFGPDRLILGRIAVGSPIAAYFEFTRRPLTQYDVDLVPAFASLAEDEREWLRGLGVEVFVPIYAQNMWIGLLGLGPKVSGNRYFEADLALLTTLADQTAVALENARLVEDLQRVNNDLQGAYRLLEQANVKLHDIDRLKSAFISVVTHEMRTPLANIGFSLHLLAQHGTEAWPSDQVLELESLKSGVSHARRVVDDVVNFAAFLSKQGELHLAPLDVGQLIADAVRPLQQLADSQSLRLVITAASNREPGPERAQPALQVRGDRERLQDAIHHLVHNAIKFTPAGGRVRVRHWRRRGRLYLDVTDDGVGIPPERLASVWDGFSQMADPVRRGVEGLGLGLALVKYVVGAHGGEVWARSKEGSGSNFGFYVPLDGPRDQPWPALPGRESDDALNPAPRLAAPMDHPGRLERTGSRNGRTVRSRTVTGVGTTRNGRDS